MFQARIIRQEVAITDVEGDTIDAAKEKLRVWWENDDNLRRLDWLTHSAGSAPEIVVRAPQHVIDKIIRRQPEMDEEELMRRWAEATGSSVQDLVDWIDRSRSS
jgi:hypothetical protein